MIWVQFTGGENQFFRDVPWPLCGHSDLHPHTIHKWIKCSKNKGKQIPFWSTIKNSFQINTLNYQVWKAKTSANYCMGTKTWVFTLVSGGHRHTHTHLLPLLWGCHGRVEYVQRDRVCEPQTLRSLVADPLQSMPTCFTRAGQHWRFLRPQLIYHVTAPWGSFASTEEMKNSG